MSQRRMHDLKVWPEPFKALASGVKTYEVRVNDRDFRVDDLLLLREWDHVAQRHTLAVPLWRRVVHMTPGGQWGLPDSICVMGVAPAERAATGGKR